MSGRLKNTKHRLVIQIASVVVPFFIIMFAAVVYSMYSGALKGYIKAQNENNENLLDREAEWITFTETYLLDYLESNPDITEQDIPEDKKEEIEELINKSSEAEVAAWMEAQSDEIRQYAVYYIYNLLSMPFNYEIQEQRFDRLFIIDINPPNEGFVFWDFSADGDNKPLGGKLDLKLSDHPGLEKMLKTQSPDKVFEWTDDFINKGSQYIGYIPMVIHGKVRAVLGLSFNWGELHDSLLASVRISFIIGLAGLAAAILIQFWIFSHKAITPLKKIKDGVREYIETKDSEAVIAKMAEIKERNEFGEPCRRIYPILPPQ